MDSSLLNNSEFNPFYGVYIDLVKDTHLLEALSVGLEDTISFYRTIPDSKWNYKYADGKWTIKEILLHTIDTERIFAYRALQFSRSENVALEGFDQDAFVQNCNVDVMEPLDLIEDYMANRMATFRLFRSFTELELKKSGKANNSNMSVRAAALIICGHEKHHISIIKERYL